MSTTILSFPAEIIREILHLAFSILQDIIDQTYRNTSMTRTPAARADFRQQFFCSMSLVHRSWRFQAQALLWEDIVVDSEISGRQLLASPAFGKLVTKTLPIRCFNKMNPDAKSPVYDIVRGSINVRSLHLINFTGHNQSDAGILCSPNLEGLTSLDLTNVHIYHDPTNFYTIPFSLCSLTLREYTSSMLSPFTFFSSPDITSFTFVHNPSDNPSLSYREDAAPFTLSIARQLLSLSLTSASIEVLSPAFRRCTKLQNLTLECTQFQLIEVLEAIPSPLTYLGVGMDSRSLPSAVL